MTDTPPEEQPTEPEKSRLRRFEEAVHDRFVAAEAAAEEAAGYGSLTAAREAVESAANPNRAVGDGEERPAADPTPEPPKE